MLSPCAGRLPACGPVSKEGQSNECTSLTRARTDDTAKARDDRAFDAFTTSGAGSTGDESPVNVPCGCR